MQEEEKMEDKMLPIQMELKHIPNTAGQFGNSTNIS